MKIPLFCHYFAVFDHAHWVKWTACSLIRQKLRHSNFGKNLFPWLCQHPGASQNVYFGPWVYQTNEQWKHFSSTFGMPKTIEHQLAENTFSCNMILKIKTIFLEKIVLISKIEHALNYFRYKFGEIWSTFMIRRLPLFCLVGFDFFGKMMLCKYWPELFSHNFAHLIFLLPASQEVGEYWQVGIFCPFLPLLVKKPWPILAKMVKILP